MRLMYILILSMFFAFSCSDSDECDSTNNTCYSFDVRQCQTDQFADDVDENAGKSARENALEDWLEEKGVTVKDIRLEIDFLDAVCEACDICPTGDRYFIKVKSTDDLTQYNLLNLEEGDCCDLF